MNFEQVMIKLGVDGSAVAGGLSRTTATVKAWGVSLMHSMKEYTGSIAKGFIGAEAVGKVVEFFDKIKERILFISRISKDTGANTNFVQSLVQEASKVGIPFESLSMSISKFNKTLGAAKGGNLAALKTLSDLGIAANRTAANQLTFTTSIHNLSVAFDKLHDKQKQAYLLQQAFGKGYTEMMPIFEKGTAAIDKMSEGSFFTKISTSTISDFRDAYSGSKSMVDVLIATTANSVGAITHGWALLSRWAGVVSTGNNASSQVWLDTMKQMDEEEKRGAEEKALEAAAEKDGISVAEEKAKIYQQQNDLLEKQAELQSTIADRDKLSVHDLASEARRLTGQKSPLQMNHTVTSRMRTALKIDTLEEKAQLAWERGDDKKSNQLQSEADQIRKSNPWLKRSDVNPMEKTEIELASVNKKLDDLKPVIDIISGVHGGGGSW